MLIGDRWLSEAAQACGWKPPARPIEDPEPVVAAPAPSPPPKAQRLKGKERKKAKEAA
jgi:hypothetical protein